MAAGAGDSDRLLADLLVEQGVVTRDQVAACLADIESWRAAGRSPVPTLGQLLMERGHLSRAAFENATVKIQAPPSTPPPADLPPEVRQALENPSNDVGSFVLLRLLGKGGMGEVHLAWEKKLARYVAVKFIQGQVEAQDRARFVREARIVAKLHHPNIAPVYELGERRGDPYIVMHYVQGTTIDRAPLDLAAKVRAIRDAADALHYAHAQGIVHRDIKPGNIMIAGDHVYVMDFGLARQHQVDSSLSQSGMVVGTPQFMSPEQALGDTHGVGARSDVYSLGATLFALLTGRPPFQAENIIELLQKVVNVDVEPPRQKHPEIPRDLETIVLKALDKDPERRYMTAQALAADLQRFLEGEPIQARPASLTYRIRKRLAKRKAFVGVVGAAVAAVVLLTAAFAIRIAGDRAESRAREEAMKELGGLWLQVVVAREGLRSEGTPPRETAARIAQALDRVSTFVSKHPNRPEGNFIRARGWVTLGDLDRAEADLKRTLELNPSFAPAYALLAGLKLERHVRARYGDPETRADRLARAEPLVQEADAWIRKLAGSTVSLDAWGLPPTPEDEIAAVMARALSAGVEASDRSATARILEAENEKRPSEEYCNWMGTWETDPARRIDWFNRALKRMPYHAKSRLDRGAARAAQGDLAGAVEDYTLALEISPQLAPAYFNRGNAFRELGRTSDAIADFSKVIELDPTDADAFFARGNARRDSGDPAGAIQDFDRAIGLRAGFAAAFTSRGVARKLAGDLAAAIADHAKAIEIHPGYAKAYANRGNVLLEKDDVDGAIADYSKAIEFDPGFAGGWHNRGEARRLKGDLKGAIDDHSRAIERDSKFAEAYAGRGYALLLQEDVSAALKDLEIAIRLKPEYARSYAVRGVARQAGGDDAGALADYDKAIELDPSAPDPYFNRALLRQGGGDLRGALDDLTHAIDRKPTHPEARACRGLVREQLSRYEPKLDGTAKLLRAAEEDLQAALKVTSAGWKYRPLTESSLQRVRSRLNELREQ